MSGGVGGVGRKPAPIPMGLLWVRRGRRIVRLVGAALFHLGGGVKPTRGEQCALGRVVGEALVLVGRVDILLASARRMRGASIWVMRSF